MLLIVLIIILLLAFGGGGGYYGYQRWGTGGGVGIFGLVLIILVLFYAFGGMTASLNRDGEREREEIFLPELDAIVGNPPYVRQELIASAKQKGAVKDQAKEYILEVEERAWPGINLSRQSDLHVYFWPVATQFLKDGGWFSFLTSSSWLDVRYGFALQRWVLLNFEVKEKEALVPIRSLFEHQKQCGRHHLYNAPSQAMTDQASERTRE
jgi:hypothetical protein